MKSKEGVDVVALLDVAGLVAKAHKHHSPRVQNPKTPAPAGSSDKLPAPKPGEVAIRLTIHDEEWYQARIVVLPWNEDAAAKLSKMAQQLSGDAMKKLAAMGTTLEQSLTAK
ncbi:MAG TPA: hypothetical protein VEJ63_02795 [Planctomycetota bacterium]|nr:hypothetical protein [Planctomycetota bacterium]